MEGERRGFGAGVWMNGPANAGEMAQEAPLTPAQKEDVKKIVDSWQEMISELDTSAMLMLRDAKVSASGENQILLALTKDMSSLPSNITFSSAVTFTTFPITPQPYSSS